MSVDFTISVSIKDLERLLHVKVVDVEGCGHLIKHLVESLLTQLNCLESLAECMQVDLTNTQRISYPTKDTLVLHIKWQVELLHILLECANRDVVVFHQ